MHAVVVLCHLAAEEFERTKTTTTTPAHQQLIASSIDCAEGSENRSGVCRFFTSFCVCGCWKRQKYTATNPDLKSPQHAPPPLPPPSWSECSRRGGSRAHVRISRMTGKEVEPECTDIWWEIQFLWNMLKLEVGLIDALIAPLSTCPPFLQSTPVDVVWAVQLDNVHREKKKKTLGYTLK